MDKCIGSHFDTAQVVHEMYSERFCFKDKNTWLELNTDGDFEEMPNDFKLLIMLSTEVSHAFMQRSLFWSGENFKHTNDADTGMRDLCCSRSKRFSEISFNLKQNSFKSNVLKACTSLFYTAE